VRFLDVKTDYAFIKVFDIANTASLTEEELEAQWKRHDFIYMQKKLY